MGFQPDPQIPINQIKEDLGDSNNSDNQNILTAAKGGGVSFVGRIFEYIVRFAFGILIARVVGVEQYGLYTLAITVSLIATNVAMVGLQTGMVRFLPEAIREKDDQATWGIIQTSVGIPLIFSIVLSLGLLLLADNLAVLLFHDPRMASLLRIASLLIPLDTISFLAYVITISYKQPKYSVIANNILSPVIKLVMAAAFLAIGLSTEGILIAQVIASTAGLLVLIYFINSLFPLIRPLGSAFKNTRKLIRYSLTVYWGWIVNTLSATLTTLALGFVGLASGVGVYTAASRFSMIGSMFYLSIGSISTPIFADLYTQGNAAQLKAYYQTTARWLIIFNLPVFLTSILYAKPLLWIFGDDFTTGFTSMIILAFGTLTYTSTGLGANVLDMTDHPKVNSINSVILVIVLIILNILLVPRYEVIGAALATSISTIVVDVICLIEVWLLLRIQPYNRSLFKPLLAGFTAGLVAVIINRFLPLPYLQQLIVGGGMLWVVYIGMLLLLKLPEDDMFVVKRTFARIRFKLPFNLFSEK
jgi:O-antigen/teichoic acid export membrane protein